MSKQKHISQRQALKYRAMVNKLERELRALKNRNGYDQKVFIATVRATEEDASAMKTADKLGYYMIIAKSLDSDKYRFNIFAVK